MVIKRQIMSQSQGERAESVASYGALDGLQIQKGFLSQNGYTLQMTASQVRDFHVYDRKM
jgi:hypothetical protein